MSAMPRPAPTVCAMTNRAEAHPLLWLTWAGTGTAIATVAGNPVTSLAVIFVAIFTTRLIGREPFARLAWIMFALAGLFGALRVLLLTLTSHGIGSAWFTTPKVHVPHWLGNFDFGGTVEPVVLAQAATEVMLPIALMCTFVALNAVVDHDRMMNLIPRSLARPAIVATMALRFFPALATNVEEARVAARARAGTLHIARRTVIAPALSRTLEQSVAVGESMELRGFPARTPTASGAWGAPVMLVASAGLLMLGFARNDWKWSVVALAFAVCGIGIAYATARSTPALRAAIVRWTTVDRAVMTFLVVLVVAVVVVTRDGSARWLPRDPVAWPRVDWPTTLAALALLFPAAIWSRPDTPAVVPTFETTASSAS